MSSNIMKILIVEDDQNECNKFKEYANKEPKVSIVATTNSETEALKLVKKHHPEGIILDLELNDGEGSGFDLLDELKTLSNTENLKIVVTTNVYSKSVYDYVHQNEVEFIYYKKQKGYSVEKVINTLLRLKGFKNSESTLEIVNETTKEDQEATIRKIINEELDEIGVSTHLQGRKYLEDSIYYVITNQDSQTRLSIVQYLIAKYKKASSTISKAMQNAILYAWRVSSLDDISEIYTARINHETGVPTPTEFIYFYADKVKKEL